MPLKPGQKIWIAEAPAGVVSTGPTVIYDLSEYGVDPEESLTFYRENGWDITEAVVVDESSP